jgi:hypothetical protein
VTRDRDPSDRRGVVVRAVPDRTAELLWLYSGMNGSLGTILAGYRDDELELIADFLRRIADAGRDAAYELAGARASSTHRPRRLIAVVRIGRWRHPGA